MTRETESAAVRLMAILYRDGQEATGHSWERLNAGLYDGLMLAVQIGLKFDEGDIDVIAKRFNGGYWFGAEFERFYNVAVQSGNDSAWKAYEFRYGRKPFIWSPFRRDGITINSPSRLTRHAEFHWKGELVRITSFNDEKGYLVAQSYTQAEGEDCEACGNRKTYPEKKILHRYQITHADFKAEKAARKKAKVDIGQS
jgi:hypothetical protein